jgi:hypothetical protein
VRLAGERSVLVLQEASGTNSAGAEIDVCPVTASWEPSRGASLDTGPTFDASRCAHGDRQDDGTWHFDLDATGADVDAPNGFAVVRAPSSTAVFDVVFDPSPVG